MIMSKVNEGAPLELTGLRRVENAVSIMVVSMYQVSAKKGIELPFEPRAGENAPALNDFSPALEKHMRMRGEWRGRKDERDGRDS